MTENYSGINPDGTLKKFSTPTPSTPASIAASSGDLSGLQKLSNDELIATDEHGNTPLIWAADSGKVNTLDHIINVLSEEDKGTQSNHVNFRGYLGNTALGRASRGGHVECVKALISHSLIDPNICNEKMQYPLHFGAFKKHKNVVEILLNSGKCNTCVKDRKGRTPAEDTNIQDINNMIITYRKKNNISAS